MNKGKNVSVCVALDPYNVGSTVTGYVTKPRLYGTNKEYVELSARATLSDCGRSITWELDTFRGSTSYLGGIKKLNRAIKALETLRDAMVANEPLAKKLKVIASANYKASKKKKQQKSEPHGTS